MGSFKNLIHFVRFAFFPKRAGGVIRFIMLGLPLATAVTARAEAEGRIPGTNEMAQLRRIVETLRGKKFLADVPARRITATELRAIVDREFDKEYPGRKLGFYQDLQGWLDVLPPHTDLKSVYADYLEDQLAGLYDSDTKTMCIPEGTPAAHKTGKKASEKKLDNLAGLDANIVFIHEFTHALEDQYWPIDDPARKHSQASTDRESAQTFLLEGSATRLMLEGVPSQIERERPGTYLFAWNLIHSDLGEAVFNHLLRRVWKSADAEVAGVPEILARSEAMPYAYGYVYCSKMARAWGLDGLDYIYDHPPVSSEQIMHPEKAWAWRDLPVQITLPETLPGGWQRVSDDTVGEAGMAALFGCQLKNLNRGSRIARGWDGDRAALYEGASDRHLLVWVSAWDSAGAAQRFAGACLEERRSVHHAIVMKQSDSGGSWASPDGRAGRLRREGKHVFLFESEQAVVLADARSGG